MITKKSRIFLLVFLTTNWINFAEPSLEKDCPTQEIGKDQLEVNVIPFNFRSLDADNDQSYRLMSMHLSVEDSVKTCMDENRYNLTIGLDQPFVKDDRGMQSQIANIATKHIINVGEKQVDIESCQFDDNQVSDKELIDMLGLANGMSDKGKAEEFIFFTASSKLWDMKENIANIKIGFEKKGKEKMCDYRGGCENFNY